MFLICHVSTLLQIIPADEDALTTSPLHNIKGTADFDDGQEFDDVIIPFPEDSTEGFDE